ncbi:MAG: FG-GAP-like repeat-containing protein, partial [Bacteroidota bacterium]
PDEVWLNNGAGEFTLTTQSFLSGAKMEVELGDLDGDGDVDAVVIENNQVLGLVNDGSANFTAVTISSPADLCCGELGDLDGDGDLDLMIGRTGNLRDTVLINNSTPGNFAFVAGASLGALDNTEDLALADMDGDGDLDGVINRAVIYFNQSVLQLVASDPPFNSHRAPRDSVFAFTFNNVLDPSSIDSSKVTLHGNLSGYHAGTITVFDSTIYYDPDVPFFPGEKVEVILDSAIRGPLLSLGKSVHGHFRVRAGVGPAVFELNPQSFGSDDTRNISLGDFDEDGYLDLFIAKRVGGFGAIGKSPNEVWLNNGDGTFRQHGPSLDNERSRMAGIGDFDRDGHLDAYVINSTDPNRIYYGDGLGGFGQPVQSTTGPFGSFFYGVALGDLDGDGDLDAVECGSINVSRILINNGARNFVPQSPSFSGISRTGHAELKDLDGDQDLDIFFVPRQSGSQNCIWYNDGNANFTSAGNINSLGQSDEIALGDLNQDGLYDAVIAFDNSLYLWMQDSTGGFPYNGQQVDSRATAGIDLADLDGDGDLDLLAAAPDPGDTSRVWINDGNGNFTLGNTAWGPDESFGVTAGDLDNDGDLDIAWGNHFRTSRVFFNRVPALALDSVFPHPNARNTSPLTEIRAHYDEAVYPPSVAPKTLAAYGSYSGYRAGTFSTDTSRAQLQPTPAFLPGERVHVLADTALGAVNIGSLRDFQWEFTVAVPSGFARFVEDLDFADTTQTDARAIALADLNGDTLLDAVVGIGTKNVPSAILINTGGQLTASLQPQLRSDSTAALALGDLDGDGDPDLFEANHTGPHRIYRNGPNHIFVPVDSLPGSPVRALQLADLDADADLDALLLLENGPHQIWRNDGTGRFTPAPGGFGSADAYDLAFADFDRDGDLDLYLGVDGNGDEIWENDGRGNFTLSAQVLGFYDSRAVAVADLNGDHYPDVLVAHALPPYFVPYFNDQSGNLRDSLGFGSHPASDIRLGDLDADGDSDLWALGANAQPSRIYRNGGLGDFTPTAQELMNSQGGALALGDLDQDGDLDAFAANSANGSGATRDQIWINCDVPPVDLGPDTVLCAGESIVLESGAGPFTRVWQNGLSSNQTFTASATGTYFVQVTNQDGCSAYDTVRVWVQPLPPVAVQDLDSLGYCPGDTVALAADRDAYALRLDGVNDFISADTYPGITGQSARTLEAWVRITDNLQNGAVIATWGAAQVGAQMEFRLNDDAQAGALGALMLDAGGGWKIGTTPVNDSAWHHVALVLDSGATVNVADALLYLDGVEEHYTAVNPVPVNTVAGPDLRIGQAAVGGNLEGEIGELRLWRTARSPAQITADQFVVFGPNVPDLALLWRFTEGLGSGTLADSSGSGHAGTLRFIDLQNNWRPALPGRDLFWDMGDGTAFSGISAAHVYGSNLSYNGRHQVTSTRWGCEASQAFAVNFDQAPNVFISSASGPFCENEPPILLTGRSGLAPGTFTGNGLSNVQDSTAWFTPAAAGVGTTPIVYTVNSPAGCTYSRSEIYVVNARPGVSMAPIPLLYNDTDPPQSLSGTPAGGSFSGPGVTGNSFAPAIAMVGLHPIVYTYADPNGCVGRDTVLVEVIGPNSATIQGILGLFCANDTGTYALSGVPFDPQGRFFGDGVDSSGNYVPANGTGLFDTIHYVYRDLNASNVQDTVTRTIGVRSAPTADLLPVSDPFCRNVNLVLLEDSLEVAPG